MISPETDVVTLFVSTGPPTTEVPGCARTLARRRGRGADRREAEAGRPRGQLERAAEHGHRAGPEAGRRGRGGDVGPDQRLGRAEADRRPVRARASRTSRRSPSSRDAGFAVARRDADSNQPRGDRHRPVARRRRDRAERRDDHADGLAGPADGGGARRDVARPGHRRGHARGLRLRGERRATRTRPTRPSTASCSRRIPAGGAQAEPGSPVTIVVGRFVLPAGARSCRKTSGASEPAARKVRVAVLMGGRSSEHEISLASARSVLAELDPERYEAVTVEIGRDGTWALGPGQAPLRARRRAGGRRGDAARAGCRRAGGRDARAASTSSSRSSTARSARTGPCRGCWSSPESPTSGAGVAASALCMDKDLFKAVLRDRGIAVARHHAIRLGDEVRTRSTTRCS